MQKIRKILRAVSEKIALLTSQPTNQPIITNNTDLMTSPAPVQSFVQYEKQNFKTISKLDATVHFDSKYLTIY